MFASQTGRRIAQTRFKATPSLHRVQHPRKNQGQPHDPPVRMLRAHEWKRDQRQMRCRSGRGVPAVTAEPLRRRLLGAGPHQQAAQSRRELEGCGQGYLLGLDAENNDSRIEDGVARVRGIIFWRSIVSLPARRDRTQGRRRRTIGETVVQTNGQVCDVSFLFARTSCASRAISALLRLSKSISYGVNIRGAGEVPTLRLSKAIEGVAEVFPPPFLEVRPVSFSEFT